MNKKIIPILLISFLAFTLILIPSVSATQSVIASQNLGDAGITINNNHPTSNTTASSALFQTWKATATAYPIALRLTLQQSLVISGSYYAEIRGITGTYGSGTAQPNDTIYAISTAVSYTAISGSYTTVTFNFVGTWQAQSGADYSFIIYQMGKTAGQGGTLTAYIKTGNSYSGEIGWYRNSTWQNTASDFTFYIDASDVSLVPPTPSPSPTPTDDYKWDENTNSWSWWNGTHWIPSSGPSPTANAQIVTFTGNMITYIVPLLLLLLPAVVGAWALGRAGAAKWGFIAGLNIGAIMCYLYLPSFGLWAVIAIVLVDIVMVFASQRGE